MGFRKFLSDTVGSVKNMIPGGASIRMPDHGAKGEHDPANNKVVGTYGGSGASQNVRYLA